MCLPAKSPHIKKLQAKTKIKTNEIRGIYKLSQKLTVFDNT